MKIAIVIGHHEKSKGAFSPFFGMREYDFYKEVVKKIYPVNSNYSVDFYEHDSNISGYTTRIKDTTSKLNKVNYDLVLSLHFNSFEPQANGCETLYFYKSKLGKKYAQEFNLLFTKVFRIKNRGIKALTNKKDRGFAICYYPKAPVILLEPFFGSNLKDCENVQHPKNIADTINIFLTNISNEILSN